MEGDFVPCDRCDLAVLRSNMRGFWDEQRILSASQPFVSFESHFCKFWTPDKPTAVDFAYW